MEYKIDKCCICGLEILPGERKNREHEPPVSRGGTPDGWKYAHSVCNSVKSNLTMPEFTPIAHIRYLIAYYHWRLKPKDKKVIRRIYPEYFTPIVKFFSTKENTK